jgi:hypothetical protein
MFLEILVVEELTLSHSGVTPESGATFTELGDN